MTGAPIALTDATVGLIVRPDVAVPRYDRSTLTIGTVHFGVGGFHRAHQAMYVDTLMNEGLAHDWAICGVGLLPGDRAMADVLAAQDGLYTLITKDADGSRTARVIGSIVDHIFAPDDPARVFETLTSRSTRVVTMTITEAGYHMHRVTGCFDASGTDIAEDVARVHEPRTVFGFIVEALARRRDAGLEPFTVVSCDNMQGGGDIARRAIVGFARLRDDHLADWIDSSVAFPNSMVDRITPATTSADREMVRASFGISDRWPVVCEPYTAWAIEDRFSAGRPPWERAGVHVVGDVLPYEHMKLRMLNAGHQALAYAGSLLGYRYVADAMADPSLAGLLRRYLHDEAIPSVPAVPGEDLAEYAEQVITRFGNQAVGDTIARLGVDGSERMPKFVLPVLAHQLQTGGPIEAATTIVASWARWCEGVDEVGDAIALSDPLREGLIASARAQHTDRLAFVRNRDIFGDLVDDSRFADTYRRVLSRIIDSGVRAAVDAGGSGSL